MHQIIGFDISHLNTGVAAPGWLFPTLAVLAIWGLFWKSLALWHAAQRGEKWWFIVVLIVNTAGILELIYLFMIARLKADELFSSRV